MPRGRKPVEFTRAEEARQDQQREWLRGLACAEKARAPRGALVSKVNGARTLINLGLAKEGKPGMNNAPTITLTDAGRAMLAEMGEEATTPPPVTLPAYRPGKD